MDDLGFLNALGLNGTNLSRVSRVLPKNSGQPKANKDAVSRVSRVVPSENNGKVSEKENLPAPGEGGGQEIKSAAKCFQVNPMAVCLVLAVCEKTGADKEEITAALDGLRCYPPDEQVRLWVRTCKELNINPWMVMHLPSLGTGAECTRCSNIELIHDRLGNERRQFHWTCRDGYQIMEQGRHTERILIAPPECRSWERWQPGRGESEV